MGRAGSSLGTGFIPASSLVEIDRARPVKEVKLGARVEPGVAELRCDF